MSVINVDRESEQDEGCSECSGSGRISSGTPCPVCPDGVRESHRDYVREHESYTRPQLEEVKA